MNNKRSGKARRVGDPDLLMLQDTVVEINKRLDTIETNLRPFVEERKRKKILKEFRDKWFEKLGKLGKWGLFIPVFWTGVLAVIKFFVENINKLLHYFSNGN